MGYENFEIKKRKTYEKYTYIYIYIYIYRLRFTLAFTPYTFK